MVSARVEFVDSVEAIPRASRSSDANGDDTQAAETSRGNSKVGWWRGVRVFAGTTGFSIPKQTVSFFYEFEKFVNGNMPALSRVSSCSLAHRLE